VNNTGSTELPVVNQFDLNDLQEGQTVLVETIHSWFKVSKTSQSHLDESGLFMRGIVLSTNSPNMRDLNRESSSEFEASNRITRGSGYMIAGRLTSRVQHITPFL
jgi:hypothetical protein